MQRVKQLVGFFKRFTKLVHVGIRMRARLIVQAIAYTDDRNRFNKAKEEAIDFIKFHDDVT